MKTQLNECGQPNTAVNRQHRQNRSRQELIGLCKGVLADGAVCLAEAEFMFNWLQANPEAADHWPGDVLVARLIKIWENGTATNEELNDLKELMADLTGLAEAPHAALMHNLSTSLPVDKPEPEIEFTEKSFCFTGKMVCGPRKFCEETIKERGGICAARVTTTLDYLVIGFLGSQDWKHSTHGTKILQAVDYKKKGHDLKVITEEHWLKFIQL